MTRPSQRALAAIALAFALAFVVPSSPATARDSFLGGDREGSSSIQLSGGFTSGPETALSAFQVSHFLTDTIALAPVLQLGVADDHFLFAPSLDAKIAIDVDAAPRLLPFVQGGLGFAYIDEQRSDGRDDDDVGFLIHAGGGAEWFVTDRLSLGTAVFFNFLPGSVQGEDFFFSWHVITFSVWF
jgi:hypothetical protein